MVCVLVSQDKVEFIKRAKYIDSSTLQCFLSLDIYQNEEFDVHLSLNGGLTYEENHASNSYTMQINSEP